MIKFHDKEIEFSVLAQAVTSDKVLFDVMELTEDDFYDTRNKKIFNAIKSSWDKEHSCSLIQLKHELKLSGMPDDDVIDLIGYIAKSLTVINSEQVVKILRTYSHRRKIYLGIMKAKEMAGNLNIDNDDIIDLLNQEISLDNINDGCEVEFFDLAKDGLDGFIDCNYRRTGIPDLDKKIIGFFGGELIIIAARPGRGKTTLSLQMAKSISEEYGRVLYFSLEMQPNKLGIKFIANHTRINSRRILSGDLNEQERDKILNSFPKLSKMRLTMIKNRYSLNQILTTIRKQAVKQKLAAVFIDYIQLIELSTREPRHLQLAEVSRRLKQTADEFNIPIIVLSQLTRLAEDAVPKLNDLRESGNLEQDADQVIFIDVIRNDENRKMRPQGGPVNIISAKNRMGETGFIELYYEKRYSEFYSIDDIREEQVINSDINYSGVM
jgi:replicative DNA helicase